MDTPDGDTLVMLVVDLPQRMKFEGDPETASLLSDTYGGAWFGACLNGEPTIAFALVDLTKADTPPGVWYFDDPPEEVVTTCANVPHLVAVIPLDAPGIDDFGRSTEHTVALVAYAVVVEVSHQLGGVRRVLPRHEAPESVDDMDLVDLVDLGDPGAVDAALAPVRSRVARASGELLAENQLLPMAWRPWHYGLIQADAVTGLLWQWPVIQIFFELRDPRGFDLSNLPIPTREQERKLCGYLSTVERLARSMSINSGGSVKATWSRGDSWAPVEVDAPHDDALTALLPILRQLFDDTEGSGSSFNQIRGLLSQAAREANLADFSRELKRWKRAHTQLRHSHLDALRHELAEEVSGESLASTGRAMPGAPEINSEELISTFMYGETLHRDEGKAARITQWDSDPLLGPLMRQEVRDDAAGLVHFYGAFGLYVDDWLAHAQGR